MFDTPCSNKHEEHVSESETGDEDDEAGVGDTGGSQKSSVRELPNEGKAKSGAEDPLAELFARAEAEIELKVCCPFGRQTLLDTVCLTGSTPSGFG